MFIDQWKTNIKKNSTLYQKKALFICFITILKGCSKDVLRDWWKKETVKRLFELIEILKEIQEIFEVYFFFFYSIK
jgi:hypothetical protein